MSQDKITGRVNIAVALSCEARPLIDHYRLKRSESLAGFALYQNSQGICLIVTGIGKIAMSSACGYLAGIQASQGSNQAAWLNLGIAGHQSVAVGELLRVGKVSDRSNGNTYYPSMMLKTHCATARLISVDKPDFDYAEDAAYDMEASAFYATVSRFAASELVHIIKLVSDNPDHPAQQLSKPQVQQWVSEKLELITAIVSQLQEDSVAYNRVYTLPPEYWELQEKWRLSFTQEVQFANLYRRYYALGGLNLSQKLRMEENQSAKSLLTSLVSLVESL